MKLKTNNRLNDDISTMLNTSLNDLMKTMMRVNINHRLSKNQINDELSLPKFHSADKRIKA